MVCNRPTGCPSAAASAPLSTFKKPTISRAKRSAAWACSALRHLSFGVPRACADHTAHDHALHNGRSVTITRIWNQAQHHGPLTEPRTSGITLPITGDQHNEPSSHARHNGHWHDGSGTTCLQEVRFAASKTKRNVGCLATDAERVGVQLP